MKKKSRKNRIRVQRVENLHELRSAISDAKNYLHAKPDEELWFRGVPSATMGLTPSLHRCFKGSKLNDAALRSLETDLFFEFLAKSRINNGTALDHWDVLFLMQHYRAPTRLLDWTEVLFVALHFATGYLKDSAESTPRIYAMNPYQWNEEHYGERDIVWPRYFSYDAKDDYFYEYGELLVQGAIDWEAPIALYPSQRDSRLSAQRAYFTIHGYDHRPMEEISPKFLCAIDLGPTAVEEVSELMKLAGIDEYSLFPDLEGLSRSLRSKHAI